VLVTLALELVGSWAVFAPRRPRIIVAVIASVFQVGIIFTSNYGFLNILVLALGVSLVDDRALGTAAQWITQRLPKAAREAVGRYPRWMSPWRGGPASLTPVEVRRGGMR